MPNKLAITSALASNNGMSTVSLSLSNSLREVSPEQWNALNHENNPFLMHEFLYGMEKHHCIGQQQGWHPRYLLLSEKNQLIGALPMYLKDHSWGEFVFDWAWANAYERLGRSYYPKLVVAVPFSPVTGQRLLVSKQHEYNKQLQTMLINGAINFAKDSDLSSLHWLFTTESETHALNDHGLDYRLGYQFHWRNHDYQCFDEYLATLKSSKRKMIKRERRRVEENNITFRKLCGHEITKKLWQTFYRFYSNTCVEKGNIPRLTLNFFIHLSETMPDKVALILAYYNQQPIAAAFFLRSQTHLYGRYWGCSDEFHSLHFETCYYQAIEYCIENEIKCFEPGAQGEYKISRGFLPTPTYSSHWIKDADFRKAVTDFLRHERTGVKNYMVQLGQHGPFKTTVL